MSVVCACVCNSLSQKTIETLEKVEKVVKHV